MHSDSLSFFQRLPLALANLLRILFDGQYAARISQLSQATNVPAAAQTATPPAPPAAPVTPPPAAPVHSHAPSDAALQLLALFQREARLIDFTREDLSQYADADIGAAARVVHEGCRKVLNEHFVLEPVRTEAEGSTITVPPGFDAHSIRLTGNVMGQAPFQGSLAHAGWRASSVNLPKLATGIDTKVLAPAEVEL